MNFLADNKSYNRLYNILIFADLLQDADVVLRRPFGFALHNKSTTNRSKWSLGAVHAEITAVVRNVILFPPCYIYCRDPDPDTAPAINAPA